MSLQFNLAHAQEKYAEAICYFVLFPCVEYFDAMNYWQKRVQEYTNMVEDQNG